MDPKTIHEVETRRRESLAETMATQALRTGLMAALLTVAMASLRAQTQLPQLPVPNSTENDTSQLQPPMVDRTLAILHGVVRNATTGEGVARALVQIEGDASTGALTDGDGRFEILDVPVGPQEVEIRKPGFLDATAEDTGVVVDGGVGPGHNVLVAADMGDVVFTLAPTCAIRGQVDLSSGDPAEGIQVTLLARAVSDGRGEWMPAGIAKTRSDGSYRFGGLANGEYKVYTEPSLDSNPASTLVEPGRGGAAERWGYATDYYPDARDLSGAAQIEVANGETAQANFTLTREPFETVTATMALPQPATSARGAYNYSAQVMDSAGHLLPYGAQYDQNAKVIEAALPDGSYTMMVSTSPRLQTFIADGGAMTTNAEPLTGSVDFSVAGHAVTNLRVPLSEPAPSPVEVNVERSGAENEPAGNERGMVVVTLSRSGGQNGSGMDDGMASLFATGSAPGQLKTIYMPPGSYWVHTHIAQNGLCEQSFTAGGANLAREPLTNGLSGVTAPLDLTLRDDCAQLALSLEQNLMSMAAGEEKFYLVYVVPDFDFTGDLEPVTLRPSTGGTITLNGLTPGNYHVYTLEGNAQLEYRNPAVLASLTGQPVTLSPGATSNLVVQTPEQ